MSIRKIMIRSVVEFLFGAGRSFRDDDDAREGFPDRGERRRRRVDILEQHRSDSNLYWFQLFVIDDMCFAL